MKYLITLVFFFFSFQSLFSQTTYNYCYLTYIGDDTRYLSVCKINPFSPLEEKPIDGYNRPEADFRKWLKNSFSEVSGVSYYFAVTKEEAIGYYKNEQTAYQAFGREYKKSTYCPIIFWIPYVEKVRNDTKSTNSTNNSSSSTSTISSNRTYTPTTTATKPTTNSLPKGVYSGSYPNNSSTNTEAKTSTAAGSTSLQRQAALEAEQLRKLNEQRALNAANQKFNQDLSNQIVQGTTELAGMLGNIFAQNRKDREKREAKKDAERLAVAQEALAKKQEWDDLFSWSAQRHLEAFAAGEESAAIELGYDKLILDKPDEAEKWYGQAAERGDVRGMMGMSDVTRYRLEKLAKTGVKRNDKKQVEEMKFLMLQWQEKAVMAGSIEACSTLVAYYGADPKMTSFALLKGDERIISILKRGERVGYMTPFRHLGIIFAKDGSRKYAEYIANRKMADTTGAFRLLYSAAENYSSEALVELLKIYATKNLQNSDTSKVLQILTKAAMLGNIEAIDNLIYCYSTGYGVKKNTEKAAYWNNQKALYIKYGTDLFTASHELHSRGQAEFLYSNTNYQKSMEYFLEAAALGNARAMERISYYYSMPGMTQDGPDLVKSQEWKVRAKLALREKPYDIE